jgi:sialate O-acetylesterase
MNLPQAWEQAVMPDASAAGPDLTEDNDAEDLEPDDQAKLATFDGFVWFRRTLELPAAWEGKDLALRLGPIADSDTAWFNGAAVGSTDGRNAPREYRVPGALVKAGKATLAVRVLNTQGQGGFVGQAGQMTLAPTNAASQALSLAGAWRYRDSTPLAKTPPRPQPAQGLGPNTVGVLFNGMIAPLVPFAAQGAIWYQGESNAGRAKQYQTLLPTLIRDWRSRFGVGDFPFYIVQLANFMAVKPEPGESGWAELREAQWLTTRAAPPSGLAAATDIGDARDIHPRNKQEVGRRLALNALALTYGKALEYSGPTFAKVEPEGAALRVTFDHADGLVARGEKLEGFAVAGEDRKFVWADAEIQGPAVRLTSAAVEKPAYARYGWADNPVCNLYNRAGLPAVPFRTDAP